ncbi:MAG: type II CRISPR-associated endonuclease Cas1 [Thermogutta sp.]
MINHVVELANKPAKLSVRHRQLVIKTGDELEVTLPLAELAVLIAANPCITLTQPVLAGLAEAGAVCVICDATSRPVGTMFPLVNHHIQTERLAAQAQASLPTRKRLWQQIVRSKIQSQAGVLQELHGRDYGLARLAARVRSGDTSNVEAMASRRYWRHLFQDRTFRRDPDRNDQNRFLNYGYAILRAVTARAITGVGLHPSLGIHHHNRYNPFCLADDLMEPFRPRVDLLVVGLLREFPADAELTPEVKSRLLRFLEERYFLEGESRTLFDVLSRIAASLADVFLKKRRDLLLPDWNCHASR